MVKGQTFFSRYYSVIHEALRHRPPGHQVFTKRGCAPALAGKIDRVLVDAPCSGLGTLRRNPDLKWRQSPKSVEELQAKQKAILDSAARLLKPGGRLVYATCSLLEAENEAVVAAFDEARGTDFVPVAAAEVLESLKVEGASQVTQGRFLRLWPHRHQTDGFFAAVWQRR